MARDLTDFSKISTMRSLQIRMKKLLLDRYDIFDFNLKVYLAISATKPEYDQLSFAVAFAEKYYHGDCTINLSNSKEQIRCAWFAQGD